MFKAPGRSRERILLIGSPGTGKTTSWLRVARMHQVTGTPARFYVLDSDDTVDRFLETEYKNLVGVVEHEIVRGWPEWESVLDRYLGEMTSDDFLVVDMIGKAWWSVQDHFVSLVMGKDLAQFYLEARMANKRGTPLDGWKDWSVINRIYKGWSDRLFSAPGHIIAVTGIEGVSSDGDDAATKLVFGPYGVKPQGQKHLGHEFHTVLWMRSARAGDWAITTIKDRGRSYWTGEQVRDFAVDYLRGTAGWVLG